MKSISEVTIRNFQSHANTNLEFAPAGQLTVITGDTDSGKTAVLRALRWVMYNEPSGTDFIRAGFRTAEVMAFMADGRIVSRRRTPSLNQYITNVAEGTKEQEQIYEGFGLSVPPEVQAILGVSPAKIIPGEFELNLNIAEQLDGPFLGSSTMPGSYRAKVLGKLAGTEDVDSANKKLGTDIYRHDRDVERVKADLETKEEQIEALDWVEGLGVKIVTLESLADLVKKDQEALTKLNGLKAKRDLLDERIKNGKEYLTNFDGLEKATEKISATTKKHQRLSSLDLAKSKLDNLSTSINDSKLKLENYKNLGKLEDILAEATPLSESAKSLKSLKARYAPVTQSVTDVQVKLERSKDVSAAFGKIEAAEKLTKTLEQFKSFQRRYKPEEIEELKESLDRLGEVSKAVEFLDVVSENIVRRAALHKAKSGLVDLSTRKDKAQSDLEQATSNIDVFAKEYEKALAEAGICPTCGAETCKHNLEEVI